MGEFSTRPPHAPIAPRQTRSFDRHAGKGFIVTGAAGGIGRAAALRFALACSRRLRCSASHSLLPLRILTRHCAFVPSADLVRTLAYRWGREN